MCDTRRRHRLLTDQTAREPSCALGCRPPSFWSWPRLPSPPVSPAVISAAPPPKKQRTPWRCCCWQCGSSAPGACSRSPRLALKCDARFGPQRSKLPPCCRFNSGHDLSAREPRGTTRERTRHAKCATRQCPIPFLCLSSPVSLRWLPLSRWRVHTSHVGD